MEIAGRISGFLCEFLFGGVGGELGRASSGELQRREG